MDSTFNLERWKALLNSENFAPAAERNDVGAERGLVEEICKHADVLFDDPTLRVNIVVLAVKGALKGLAKRVRAGKLCLNDDGSESEDLAALPLERRYSLRSKIDSYRGKVESVFNMDKEPPERWLRLYREVEEKRREILSLIRSEREKYEREREARLNVWREKLAPHRAALDALIERAERIGAGDLPVFTEQAYRDAQQKIDRLASESECNNAIQAVERELLALREKVEKAEKRAEQYAELAAALEELRPPLAALRENYPTDKKIARADEEYRAIAEAVQAREGDAERLAARIEAFKARLDGIREQFSEQEKILAAKRTVEECAPYLDEAEKIYLLGRADRLLEDLELKERGQMEKEILAFFDRVKENEGRKAQALKADVARIEGSFSRVRRAVPKAYLVPYPTLGSDNRQDYPYYHFENACWKGVETLPERNLALVTVATLASLMAGQELDDILKVLKEGGAVTEDTKRVVLLDSGYLEDCEELIDLLRKPKNSSKIYITSYVYHHRCKKGDL